MNSAWAIKVITNTAAGGVAPVSNFRQVLVDEIANQLSTNFTILAGHPKALQYIVGVVCVESGQGLGWGNVSVRHQVLPNTVGFGKYFESHQVTKAARSNVAINQANLTQGRQAQSVLGCMGAYLIRGLQNGPKGFPHVQSAYAGVAESVGCLVNPGESITALFTEDIAGLKRGLVAGMCVLEYNYKIYIRKYAGDKDRAMKQTIKSHLGSPNTADVITGINGDDYFNRVLNNSNGFVSSTQPPRTSTVNTTSSDLSRNTYFSAAQSSVNQGPLASGVSTPGKSPGCGA